MVTQSRIFSTTEFYYNICHVSVSPLSIVLSQEHDSVRTLRSGIAGVRINASDLQATPTEADSIAHNIHRLVVSDSCQRTVLSAVWHHLPSLLLSGAWANGATVVQ